MCKYQDIIDNIKFEEDNIRVKIVEDTWCEHCGVLPPYTAIIDFDGICYCLDCSRGDVYLTGKEELAIDMIETDEMIKYHIKVLEGLARHKDRLEKMENE